MPANIKFERKTFGAQDVQLLISGSITLHTSPQLHEQLKPLFTGTTQHIHVKLDHVEDIDSSGIATLVEGLRWSRLTGGKFVLSGMRKSIQKTLSLTKLDTAFEIAQGSPS